MNGWMDGGRGRRENRWRKKKHETEKVGKFMKKSDMDFKTQCVKVTTLHSEWWQLKQSGKGECTHVTVRVLCVYVQSLRQGKARQQRVCQETTPLFSHEKRRAGIRTCDVLCTRQTLCQLSHHVHVHVYLVVVGQDPAEALSVCFGLNGWREGRREGGEGR